jgi:hypothetical protein
MSQTGVFRRSSLQVTPGSEVMKRRNLVRTPSLRPLAAGFAIAFAGCLAVAQAHVRPLSLPAQHRDIAALKSAPPGVRGAIVVTNCDDSGPGSLREAYFNAIDNDEIDLSQLDCSTISLTTGALTNSPSADNVILVGPGKYDLTIDGGNRNRVLVHNGSEYLQVFGLSLTGGSYIGPYGGGCIYSYGSIFAGYANISGCSLSSSGTDHAYGGAIYAKGGVILEDVHITGSTAHAASSDSAGGAVWAGGKVQIVTSTISGNSVAGDGSHYARGGGLFALTDVRVAYSTFADNTADSGGGIFLAGAADYPMQVANSTISGNHARGAGGGLYSKYRPLELSNSTITANTAVFDFGAGAYLVSDTDIESTIVAGNTSQDGLQASDVGGNATITITGANNLIFASTLPVPIDTIDADPMLGPLQDNGGFSATHALLPGSPAIDHGNNVLAAVFDQRGYDETTSAFGYEREVGASADIGAFEFGAPDHIFVDGFDS